MTDYQYYKATYHGTMGETDFLRYVIPAAAYLNAITYGRAQENLADDRVRLACCAVADAYRLNENGGGVVSETVGKISRNYAAGISNTPTEAQRLLRAAKTYLANTGLLYRGCNR